MNKMVCELCGGTDIVKKDGLFVCNICGCKYSTEEAKKLIGIVIDNSKLVSELIIKADELYNNKEFKKSLEYYKRVLQIEPLNEHASTRENELSKTPDINIFVYEIDVIKNFDVKDYLMKKEYLSTEFMNSFSCIKKSIDYIACAVYELECECNYSGTACFEKETPYQAIDYDIAYVNYQQVRVKKEVTKYNKEIDKKPFDGQFNHRTKFVELINKPFEFSIELSKIKGILCNENYQKTLGNTHNELADADFKKIIYTFNSLNINFEIRLNDELRSLINTKKQGDRTENFSYSINYRILNRYLVFIPIEKIVFDDKSIFYKIRSLNHKFELINKTTIIKQGVGLESKYEKDISAIENAISINRSKKEKNIINIEKYKIEKEKNDSKFINKLFNIKDDKNVSKIDEIIKNNNDIDCEIDTLIKKKEILIKTLNNIEIEKNKAKDKFLTKLKNFEVV